jgi:4-amino-4-deoxy-L-arabinose transferase-like glycosyltransferase
VPSPRDLCLQHRSPLTDARAKPRSIAREAWVLFALALAMRLACLIAFRWQDEVAGKDAWSWGYEAACVAKSIAAGHGYADQWMRGYAPFDQPSGATGWLPPAYPALMALLFKLFGVLTPTAAFVLLAIQSVLSALTCVLIWTIARALGEDRVGRLAAWILAIYPGSIWNAAHTVWDTTFAAYALALFVWILLAFGRGGGRVRPLVIGLAFGALLLVNPAPLSFAPVALVWIAWPRSGWPARIESSLLFGAGALAVCAPWLARNQSVVGAASLRTNLGVELMVGNNDVATGYFQTSLHPSYAASEFIHSRELGEVAYNAEAKQRALDWMGAHPLAFVTLVLRRMQIYWLGDPPPFDPRREGGLEPARDPKSWVKWIQHGGAGCLCLVGLWILVRRNRAAWSIAAMVLFFPLPYYVTHVLERYRFPSEPLIVLCASAAVLAWIDGRRSMKN